MYYTPSLMAKTNEPIKKDSSMHAPVLVCTIIFWGCLSVGAAGMNSFIGTVGAIVMMVLSYLIYLVLLAVVVMFEGTC